MAISIQAIARSGRSSLVSASLYPFQSSDVLPGYAASRVTESRQDKERAGGVTSDGRSDALCFGHD